MDELADKLTSILRGHLGFLAPDQELPMDAELAELGLDSMGAITLLMDLEGSFDISFPEEMLVPETFRTADSLLGAIRTLRAQG